MNGEAKYRQIAGDLREQITRGDIPPGDPLPTEADISRSYDVARMTARQALETLEREGLIEGERPRRVANRETLTVSLTRDAERVGAGESPTRAADAFLGEAAAAGRAPAQEILVLILAAPPAVADRLSIPPGSIVIARQITRRAGGSRHNMITFWFPEQIAQGTPLADPGSIEEGSLAWLERTYGPLSQVAELSARMPEPAEAEILGIGPGVPVIVVWRTSAPVAGQPVVTSMSLWPADRTVLRIEI